MKVEILGVKSQPIWYMSNSVICDYLYIKHHASSKTLFSVFAKAFLNCIEFSNQTRTFWTSTVKKSILDYSGICLHLHINQLPYPLSIIIID